MRQAARQSVRFSVSRFRRIFASFTALGIFCLSITTHSVSAGSDYSFEPGCPIPYAAIAQHRPIDDVCNRFGESSSYQPSKEAHRKSNSAKNNLCAVGPTVPLAVADFRTLMAAVKSGGIHFGGGVMPEDRSVLSGIITKNVNGTNIRVGEGTLVVFKGFVKDATYGAKESVNCNRTGVANFDIHIGLVGKKSDSRCRGIVAEMIPHYRPDAWTKTAIKKIKKPVRVSGQLFFDAPHLPCNPNGTISGSNPRRVSLWEIHPIYAFEICQNNTLAACLIESDEDWQPLGGSQ